MGRRVSSPAFVGRSDELRALEAALARAGAGEARAVFVGGESGVGKTRLLGEFERVAGEAGARTLAGACVDVGGAELPYAPIVAALRTLARDLEPDELAELAGSGGDELARLLPELGDGGGPAADPLAQSRLFEALFALLGRLSRAAPLVLVLEDLHWADPSSRGFLAFLVRNLRRERILLVATYRSDELHRRHPLRQFLVELERVPAVERLELPPFTRRELSAQLAGILGAPPEPPLVDELYERSQGNAFFAEELLAASGSGGVPDSLRDALTLRVEGLAEDTRQLLRAAAAAGSVVGHRLLAATAGLEEDALVRALREAVEHNVLVRDAGSESYSFRHALLREALYDDLLPGEASGLHAALARALERDPSLATRPHGAAAERALHWYAAHELAPALAASAEAGAEAERVWAFGEARRQYEHAVELWERVPAEQRPAGVTRLDLVRRAAEAAHLAGDAERAVALIRRAIVEIDPQCEPVLAGLLRERLGRYFAAQGALPEALAEYRAAASLLPDEPTAERAALLAGEAHVLMLQGQAEASRGPCEEAIRIARAVGDRLVECSALNTLGGVLGQLGARAEACDLLREAKRIADELSARAELLRSYANLGQTLDDDGRLEEAAAVALEGWERLREHSGTLAPFVAGEAGARLTRLGRWDEAAAVLAEAVETVPANAPGSLALAAVAELEIRRGELDLAASHLERAQRAVHGRSEQWTQPTRISQALLALARGRPEDVEQVLHLGAPDGLWEGFAVFVLPAFALALEAQAELAAAARAQGDEGAEQRALARTSELLERARALAAPENWPLGGPSPDTLLDAEICELEAARARAEPAADGWAAYAARCDELGRPVRAAYARFREGEAALAEGLPRPRVAEALAPARATAARLGARPLLEQVEQLARRARVDLPEQQPTDEAAGLTAREVDVLRLVAEGLTNREIGNALFMSPKTASVHVSHILAKLGAKSRVEAAGFAHRLGLTE